MKKLIMTMVLAMAVGSAFASPGNDGCVGNCSGGDGGSSNSNTNRANSISYSGASAGATALGVGVGGQGGSSRSTAFGGEGGNGGSARASADPSATSSNNLTINTPAKTMSQTSSVSKNSTEFRGEYRYEYEAKIHNTPSMAIGVPEASANCYVGIGGSVSAAGIGIAGATSTFDPRCEEREYIRLGQTDGDPEVRGLASYVTRLRLQEYADEIKAEQAEARASAGNKGSLASYAALTDY